MAGVFNHSINQTAGDFQKYIMPIFKAIYVDCDFIATENTDNEIATLLDMHAGIDVLIVNRVNQIVKGLASRVQRAPKCWETFTVRRERDNGTPTEYRKRVSALQHSGIFPALTSQAYISPDSENVLGLAVAPTVELWRYIENENPQIKHTGSEQSGQASFFVVPWRDMLKKKYRIMTVMPTETGWLVDWGIGKKFVTGRN